MDCPVVVTCYHLREEGDTQGPSWEEMGFLEELCVYGKKTDIKDTHGKT